MLKLEFLIFCRFLEMWISRCSTVPSCSVSRFRNSQIGNNTIYFLSRISLVRIWSGGDKSVLCLYSTCDNPDTEFLAAALLSFFSFWEDSPSFFLASPWFRPHCLGLWGAAGKLHLSAGNLFWSPNQTIFVSNSFTFNVPLRHDWKYAAQNTNMSAKD